LTDLERLFIRKNWTTIKDLTIKNKIFNYKFDSVSVSSIDKNSHILMNIKEDKYEIFKRIEISKEAKIMRFILEGEGEKIIKEELVNIPSSIGFFTKHFHMQHPIYKKKGNILLDVSVDYSNYESIFHDSNVRDIIDDKFELYIKIDEFREYRNKLEKNVSDYYDNYFSINEYSTTINNDYELENEERKKLSTFF
jgi:hypothetical protein